MRCARGKFGSRQWAVGGGHFTCSIYNKTTIQHPVTQPPVTVIQSTKVDFIE